MLLLLALVIVVNFTFYCWFFFFVVISTKSSSSGCIFSFSYFNFFSLFCFFFYINCTCKYILNVRRVKIKKNYINKCINICLSVRLSVLDWAYEYVFFSFDDYILLIWPLQGIIITIITTIRRIPFYYIFLGLFLDFRYHKQQQQQ